MTNFMWNNSTVAKMKFNQAGYSEITAISIEFCLILNNL